VLVGRNNTGKSALLESFALATTAEGGWYDALDTDLIETIVRRRGGWEHADMIIKIGEEKAVINIKGENIAANMQITGKIENLSDNMRANFATLIGDYIDSTYRRSMEMMEPTRERSPLALRSLERRILSASGRVKNSVLQQTKAYISYIDKLNRKSEYAALVGKPIADIIMPIQEEIGEIAMRYFPTSEIIRSTPKTRSRTIFMLTPSRQYLAELQKSLAISGELINLIDLMRERVSYFTDIREVDKNFLVFLKGLKRPVPLDAMGDGFRAKLAILAATMIVKNGVVLMEEPEIRLHPGFMSSIAEQIVETAAHGEAQYVISTHSLDFLRFLLEANAELLKVVRMYRIEKTAEIDFEVLSGKEAFEQVKELEADLRGI